MLRLTGKTGWTRGVAATIGAVALAVGSSVGMVQASAAIGTRAATNSAAAAKRRAALSVLSRVRVGPASISNQNSSNWSGYADTNYTSKGNFNYVYANWHVPQVASNSCNAGTFATGYGLSAFWVGLDGDGDKTVEQTGTMTECYQGNVYYYDWYEMYPNPMHFISWVNPGDQISATVQHVGGQYLLDINDVTTGSNNRVFESCPSGKTCSNRSAEVIAEAPSGCVTSPGQTCRGKLFLLPDYQWVRFTSIGVGTPKQSGGIGTSVFGPVDLTMTNTGHIKLAVVTSPISKNAFTDSWRASG